MSFRKKNVVLGPSARISHEAQPAASQQEKSLSPGIRPSPLDGCLTTSTGTYSLDQLLAGHAGLPLGNSLLIEESGTTEFAGAILRYYAAEGLVQGHEVHVLGLGAAWRGELPGLSSNKAKTRPKTTPATDEKMKIAWRYESLGNDNKVEKCESKDIQIGNLSPAAVFCHTFDLNKRLDAKDVHGQLHMTPSTSHSTWPMASTKASSLLQTFITALASKLKASRPSSVHRVIIPNLLSPVLFGSASCLPSDALQFLHKLRALLRQYSGQLTVVITLSVSLYPRATGFTRWMELLCDGVLELIPIQQAANPQPNSKSEDVVQGLLKVHSLPSYHERGGGLEGKSSYESLSFRLSSSSGLVIKPFTLPPVGESNENQETSKKGDSHGAHLEF